MTRIQRDLLKEYEIYAAEGNNQDNVHVPDGITNQETETVYDSDSGEIDTIDGNKILHFLLYTIIEHDLDKAYGFRNLLENEVFIPMFLQNHYSEMRILINTAILSAANRDTMNVEMINDSEVEDVLKQFWNKKNAKTGSKAELLADLHEVIFQWCEEHRKEFRDARDRLLQDAIDQEEAPEGTPVSSSRSTPTLEYSEEDNKSLKRKHSHEESDDELVDEGNDKSVVQNRTSQNVILERVNKHPDARLKEAEKNKPDGASDRLKEKNQQLIFTLQRIQAELEARIHSDDELIAQNQALQQESTRLVASLKVVNKKKMDAIYAKKELQQLEGVVQLNNADNRTNNTEIEQIIRENDELLKEFKTINTPLKHVYNDLVARLQEVEDKKPEEASDTLEETNQQLISTLQNIQDKLQAIVHSGDELVAQNQALQQENTYLVAVVDQEKRAAIDELQQLERVVQLNQADNVVADSASLLSEEKATLMEQQPWDETQPSLAQELAEAELVNFEDNVQQLNSTDKVLPISEAQEISMKEQLVFNNQADNVSADSASGESLTVDDRRKTSGGSKKKTLHDRDSSSQSLSLQSEQAPHEKVTFSKFAERLADKFKDTNSTGIKQIIRKAHELASSSLIHDDNKKFEEIAKELHQVAEKRVNSWWSKSHFFGHGRSKEAQVMYDKASKKEFKLNDENQRKNFMIECLSTSTPTKKS